MWVGFFTQIIEKNRILAEGKDGFVSIITVFAMVYGICRICFF